MSNPFKTIFAILILFISVNQAKGQEATQEHKDSLNNVLNKYYELNIQIFQAGSTVEDIDQLFEIFTDDFTYVHEKYGGVYSREDLYNGYIRNQKNGGYDGNVTNIKVLNKIVGLNGIAVQKVFVTKEKKKTTEENKQLAVFEFRNGKILRISEYW